jgi:hypothetical protein
MNPSLDSPVTEQATPYLVVPGNDDVDDVQVEPATKQPIYARARLPDHQSHHTQIGGCFAMHESITLSSQHAFTGRRSRQTYARD